MSERAALSSSASSFVAAATQPYSVRASRPFLPFVSAGLQVTLSCLLALGGTKPVRAFRHSDYDQYFLLLRIPSFFLPFVSPLGLHSPPARRMGLSTLFLGPPFFSFGRLLVSFFWSRLVLVLWISKRVLSPHLPHLSSTTLRQTPVLPSYSVLAVHRIPHSPLPVDPVLHWGDRDLESCPSRHPELKQVGLHNHSAAWQPGGATSVPPDLAALCSSDAVEHVSAYQLRQWIFKQACQLLTLTQASASVPSTPVTFFTPSLQQLNSSRLHLSALLTLYPLGLLSSQQHSLEKL